jgi:hypothetical protein
VLGILADANVQGQVEYLVQKMRTGEWAEFWRTLGIELLRFEDVGLVATSLDYDVWTTCQTERLVLITDNRNHEAPDSLEATIRRFNKSDSLPVFTIADMDRFRSDPTYVERVIEALYDYLLRIDDLRGAGRLYLP